MKKRLDDILAVCRFIGISWAFYEEENGKKESAEKKTSTANKSIKAKPSKDTSTSTAPQSWKNKTQLAILIAQREGKPGSRGHLLAFLGDPGNKSRIPCPKDSCWRKPLEDAGLKFDNNDYVVNWKDAKNPL